MRSNIVVLSFFFSSLASGQALVISTVAGGAPPATPVPAAQASVGDPPRVAVDSAGNLYFGGTHSVFRVDTSGTLTRLAGNGQFGYSGDGGGATAAQLEYPNGIAVDSAGNVYVADTNANVVRVIAPNGTISTYAGTGAASYTGDGGPAAQAQLSAPMGLALDSAGNLYIADSGNNVIRKVTRGGTISTYAGNGSAGYSGDGGQAMSAALNQPEGVAVDTLGLLYIADTSNNRVRVVALSGTIQTVAGTGISGFSGDSGTPASTQLFLPTDVATDSAGNLYIADLGNDRVRKVSQGKIQTVAGSDGSSAIFNEAVATTVFLNGPTGVAVDGAGNIYLAEGSIGAGSGLAVGDYRVWKINSGGVVSTAAGNGLASFSGDGGTAASAQLNDPAAVTFDTAGNLYIADADNNRVRKVTPAGVITTVAGNGTAGWSGDGGPGPRAQLNHPMGLTADTDGDIYIADTGNNRIRKLTPDGNIATIAGNGNASYYGDGGPADQGSLHSPHQLYFVSGYYLYIADTENQRIRELLPDGTITTVAGNGGQGLGGDGARAVSATLNLPTGVTGDAAGNIYVADQGNNRIRVITPGGNISTVAGGSPYGLGDGGAATISQLNGPASLALDSSGNLYFTDSGNNRVREISNGVISTVAGTGISGYSGDGGAASAAEMNTPMGLVVDAAGRIFVADSGNNAVRLLQPATNTPSPTISAVENAASNQTGAIAPGEIVVIYGSGLGPSQLAAPVVNGSSEPLQFNGVVALVNGTPAPIVYVSSKQISAIIPAGVTGPVAQVSVEYLGVSGKSVAVQVAAAAPAFFTLDSSGSGQALAINADGTVNGPSHPAAPGSTVTMFLNGVPSQFLAGPLTVTIGGQTTTIATLTPTGSAPGVMTAVLQIPSGTTKVTAAQVVAQVGGISSPAGVTLTVGSN